MFAMVNKFWLVFGGVFVLGNILVGVFESVNYDLIYPYIEQIKMPLTIEKRLFALFPFLKYLICLSYAIYSFYALLKCVSIVKHPKILKAFLGIYYVAFVFVLTNLQYCSPISYIASYLYTGFKYGIYSDDIKSYLRKNMENKL